MMINAFFPHFYFLKQRHVSNKNLESILSPLLQQLWAEPRCPQSALCDLTKGGFPAHPVLEDIFGKVVQVSQEKDDVFIYGEYLLAGGSHAVTAVLQNYSYAVSKAGFFPCSGHDLICTS